MSDKKLAIKLSTLEAIGEAVRNKEGTTDLIPVNTLADRIAALPSGVNKLPQVVDKTVTELTAEDLAGVTQIGNYAFTENYGLISIVIPDSAKKIGNRAFMSCANLTSVTIGNGVEYIDTYAFYGCSSLTSVTIPNSVTKTGDYVFYECPKLTSVTVGNGIQSFSNCALYSGSKTNKATITFLGTTPPRIASNTFDAARLEKIIVPKGCGEAYKTATNWANFADYIEEAAE